MTTGPEYMLTKPYRPLRDVEVPNFSSWVAAIRGQLATPLPAPAPSSESLLSAEEDKSEAKPAEAEPSKAVSQDDAAEAAKAEPVKAEPAAVEATTQDAPVEEKPKRAARSKRSA
jgi:hypothetical protein